MLTSIDGKEVSLPPREHRPDGETFHRVRYIMQSVSDAELMQRVFPNPLPATHRLNYRWGRQGGGEVLEVFVEPDPNAPAAAAAPAADANTAPPADTAESLEKLTKAELLTKAAVLGIADAKESDTKPVIIGKILAKLADKPAAAAAPAA